MTNFEIRACSDSLMKPEACCVCRDDATWAVLTHDFVEHTRCDQHSTGDHIEARKPLVIDPIWRTA